ncbi:alkaline phosphatase family protein [Desulfohalobium retbaense]|uniref:alkaline phosphatase family protein n=1 Tax=Desulfohalobium retbaense TaxID=45663 RepID=UPI00019B4D0E|nr:alkaline phosphatase family protein [Desulfohalobium retbaense]
MVLGLDGLPLSLAQRLSRQGVTPNLATLALDPRAGELQAEAPELSPVNWTSFSTASGPETHGIFGFVEMDRRDYRLRMVNGDDVQSPSVFQRLGEQGLTSKALNLPNTYPARSFPGMLVAGFVAPELSRAVFPRVLAGPLQDAGYILEADTVRGKADPDFLLGALHQTLAGRERALDLLWPDLAWDLFVFVLTETDRLGHFLFAALDNPEDPRHEACLDFMREWDRCLGRFLERYAALPEPKRLLSLADHGFTCLKTEVDLNVWLQQRGYLHLQGVPSDELDASVIGPGTTAFALDPGRIYLHSREAFARGTVSRRELDGMRHRLRDELLQLRFDGQPVLEDVHLGDELYPQSPFSNTPDLVCEARPGYELKAKFDRTAIFGHFGRYGTHTRGDAFLYDSEGERPRRVRDVGQAVLDFFHRPRILTAS